MNVNYLDLFQNLYQFRPHAHCSSGGSAKRRRGGNGEILRLRPVNDAHGRHSVPLASRANRILKVSSSSNAREVSTDSESASDDQTETQWEPPTIILGTFFSGIETPSIALSQVGVCHKLSFAIEKEKPLRSYIRKRWRPAEIHKDVAKVLYDQLPHCDLLVGGPPCQPWCPGGKRLGNDDDRAKLTYSMVEYCEARAVRKLALPRAVVMEQSSALLSPKNIEVSDAIVARLSKLGFKIRWRVLDTSDHGIRQSRKRCYIVAWKPWKSRSFRWPKALKTSVPLSHMLYRKHKRVDVPGADSRLNREAIRQAPQDSKCGHQ